MENTLSLINSLSICVGLSRLKTFCSKGWLFSSSCLLTAIRERSISYIVLQNHHIHIQACQPNVVVRMI